MLRTLILLLSSLDPSRAKRRFRRAAIDYAIAGTAFLLGLCFLVIAAFIWAADRWGPMEAALGFGVGFMAIAAVTMMVHRSVASRRARIRAEAEKSDQLRSFATAAAVAALPAVIRQIGVVGSLALPLAGLAAYAIWRENRSRDGDDLD